MKMTRREKLSGVLVLAGMFLTATDSLITAAAAVALLGAGVVLANWPEIRACICARTKKKAARLTRRRHTKNISYTSYQKAEEMSRCSK